MYFQIDGASLSIYNNNACGGWGVRVTIYTFGGGTCTVSHGEFSSGQTMEWDRTNFYNQEDAGKRIKNYCYIARGENYIEFKFTTKQGTRETFCPKTMYIKAGNEKFHRRFSDYYYHHSDLDYSTFNATKITID